MKPEHYPSAPAHLWEHFYQISQIPRPSRQEEAVRQYVIDQAEQRHCPWRMDKVGNIVLSVPATPGREERPTVIIQNHLDMVTVKADDKEHDFSLQPLSLQVDGVWLRADRTTLGADNGVGCAAALALLSDEAVEHPPLELLFTVDEETGLGGALNLDPALLRGDLMLNLDTEEWNELYVGCAGGGGWELRRDYPLEPLPAGFEQWCVTLRGLAGGHSGIQIHQQLGNAIKLLGQCLFDLEGVRLCRVESGIAHNVIPREGQVLFCCPAGSEKTLRDRLAQLARNWRDYLPPADAGLELQLETGRCDAVLGADDSRRVLELIAAFPHGAQAYSQEQPADLVDLSINLAQLRLLDGGLYLESSYRFFNEQQSVPLQQAVLALAAAFELAVVPLDGYPGWQPDFDSPLLARAGDLHERLFGQRPAIKAIHAGLECGILKGKKPDTDILSFGPTIRGAHSPTERLRIDTVAPFWQFLGELLAEL